MLQPMTYEQPMGIHLPKAKYNIIPIRGGSWIKGV